ncbi:hypothetical protein ACFQ51_40410 [Streptomyces kaempferi]
MPRFVAPAVPIDRRPPVIELRERLGDWEGDRATRSCTDTVPVAVSGGGGGLGQAASSDPG